MEFVCFEIIIYHDYIWLLHFAICCWLNECLSFCFVCQFNVIEAQVFLVGPSMRQAINCFATVLLIENYRVASRINLIMHIRLEFEMQFGRHMGWSRGKLGEIHSSYYLCGRL